jgi:hypothetical protein
MHREGKQNFASPCVLYNGFLGGVPLVDGILGSFLVAVFFFFLFSWDFYLPFQYLQSKFKSCCGFF